MQIAPETSLDSGAQTKMTPSTVSTVFRDASSDPDAPDPESNPVANSSKAASVVGASAPRSHTSAVVGRPAPYRPMSPSTPIDSSLRWNVSTTNAVWVSSILATPAKDSGSAIDPFRVIHQVAPPIRANVRSTTARMRPAPPRRRAGASNVGRVHAGGAGIPLVHGPRSGGEPASPGGCR